MRAADSAESLRTIADPDNNHHGARIFPVARAMQQLGALQALFRAADRAMNEETQMKDLAEAIRGADRAMNRVLVALVSDEELEFGEVANCARIARNICYKMRDEMRDE